MNSRLLLLLNPILRDHGTDWPSHLARFAKRARETGLASFDWSLGRVADEVGITLIDYLEVYCTYGKVVSVPKEETAEVRRVHPYAAE